MNERSNNIKSWALIIGLLVIVGVAAAFLVVSILQITQQAVQPVSDLTGNVSTQMAQVSKVLHPTPTVVPDPVTVIHDVRSLARLETIQYTVEKVITAETGQGAFGFLFGDKLIFVAHGVVVAGIDLSKLQPQDLVVKDGVLYAHLPDPEIFIATLDNEKSYVYNRDTGALTHGDVNLETTARQAAEDEIRKAAVEDGILNQAKVNGQNYMNNLFLSVGYKDVIFVGTPPGGGGAQPPATPAVITPPALSTP